MFITWEGMEGCGKSTQARRLAERLRALGRPCVLTFEPGGTDAGQAMRRILLDARNQGLAPLAELLLYAADRAQHVEEVIRPALASGKWVLCDRFADATTVYQGHGRGLDPEFVSLVNRRAAGGLRPDLTFLLDCPPEIGLERARRRDRTSGQSGMDRFEREHLDFHRRIREGYLSLARAEPERFSVLDARMTEEEIEARLLERLEQHVANSA